LYQKLLYWATTVKSIVEGWVVYFFAAQCSCFCSLCRYNRRIKTYMQDVNTVKKASSDNSRVSNCLQRAVDSFWPGKAARMKTLLLTMETPDDSSDQCDTLKSTSRYEKLVSFRQLAMGAVCSWQECWNLLETVKSKAAIQEPYIDRMTQLLDRMRTDLIREIDGRSYRRLAMSLIPLHSVYLHLQARRMSLFIKNPRLVQLLSGICSRDPLVSHTSVEHLNCTNNTLRSNFRIYQRDNIEDFMAHLDVYLQPKMGDFLEKKTWLICELGWSAESSLYCVLKQSTQQS